MDAVDKLIEAAQGINDAWQAIVVPITSPGIHQMYVAVGRLNAALAYAKASADTPARPVEGVNISEERARRLYRAEDLVLKLGYRFCDNPACNCGDWHLSRPAPAQEAVGGCEGCKRDGTHFTLVCRSCVRMHHEPITDKYEAKAVLRKEEKKRKELEAKLALTESASATLHLMGENKALRAERDRLKKVLEAIMREGVRK